MKYEDFWSIYFTILRIFLIFYLTHICIYLFNCHHPSYLSETASFLPMFLLLILNYCCSDGIIVEASDVFGYRVWCYHPVEHPVELVICILPVCILPDYFIGILVSSLLVLSSCWSAVVVSRRPKPVARLMVIAIYTVVIGEWLVFRYSYRDSVSRILDGSFILIWNLMKVDGHFTRDMCGGYFPW